MKANDQAEVERQEPWRAVEQSEAERVRATRLGAGRPCIVKPLSRFSSESQGTRTSARATRADTPVDRGVGPAAWMRARGPSALLCYDPQVASPS